MGFFTSRIGPAPVAHISSDERIRAAFAEAGIEPASKLWGTLRDIAGQYEGARRAFSQGDGLEATASGARAISEAKILQQLHEAFADAGKAGLGRQVIDIIEASMPQRGGFLG